MFFFRNISANYNSLMKVALFAAATTVANSAHATEITTLKQSVAYAIEHNRMLAADAGAVEKAKAGQDRAVGQFMPRLDVSTGVVRTDAPGSYLGMKLNQQRMTAADFNPAFINNPGYINNYQTRLNLNMPIYQGGALWAGRKQADHHAQSAELKHSFMQQQLIFQTVTAYSRTRQAQAAIKAMSSAVSAAQKRYQDTRALQKRGILIDSDVMDARVHLLRTRVKLQEAVNAHAQALEQLQHTMGLNGDVTLVAEEDPHLSSVQFSQEEAVQKALDLRSDLKALEQAYRAQSAAVDVNRAAFLPHVNLMAGQEWNASTPALKNRNTMIGATVSMNLFAGGSDVANMRAARADLVSLEMKIADMKQQIRNEVAHSWRMLDESRLRHESETEALKQSVESLRIKSLRYDQGLAKTSDLLDAQLLVDTSRVSGIRAKYEVTIAQAALLLAIGALDEESVQ